MKGQRYDQSKRFTIRSITISGRAYVIAVSYSKRLLSFEHKHQASRVQYEILIFNSLANNHIFLLDETVHLVVGNHAVRAVSH